MKRRVLPLAVLAVLALLALWAVGGPYRVGGPSPHTLYDYYYDGNAAAGLMTRERLAGFRAPAYVPPVPGARSPDSLAVGRGDAASSLLIRSGQIVLEVDSLEPAIAEVHALAERLGGYVGGTATRMGRGQVRSAAISLKVPAQRFDDALEGARPLGQVESVNVSTADVTEEYVDVSARTQNARRLERRLAQILANRTGALKDVLEVEQALARVREEIERYEGRLRYLREHAAMSDLAVHVHEPAPLVGHAGGSVLGAAVEQAWANFVSLAVVLIQALGFVVPLGALAAAGWLVVRKLHPTEGNGVADRGV